MSSWKIYKGTSTYFVTSSIVEWLPVFTERAMSSIITDSLKHCAEHEDLIIHGYVIMLNHIHLLVKSERNLSDTMRDFKSYTSKEITHQLKNKNKKIYLDIFSRAASEVKKNIQYKVWQDGFHPIGIDSAKFCHQKLDYIHQNPVKKGYVSKPEHWYYSSAGNYASAIDTPLKVEVLL